MITSQDNPHIKQIRKLARRAARERSGLFVAEGEDLISAAEDAGWTAVARLCASGRAAGRPGFAEVDAALLRDVSTLGSGTREIGIYEQRWGMPSGPLCVYLHGVGDPGNVGTIIRAARAFGAASVVLGEGCADPFGPKAVRASMGEIFNVPVSRGGELPGELVGLAPDGEETLRGPFTGERTLLIGSERHGLPTELRARCDRVCAIPTVAGDSLNAAMAATVALYELTRGA